jgi:hypothetical protein
MSDRLAGRRPSIAASKEVFMCPACLTAAAAILAGTTSAGGLAALLVNALRPRTEAAKLRTEGEPHDTSHRIPR